MHRGHSRRLLGLAIGALAVVGASSEVTAQKAYFAGKTLELAVSRGSGGS